MAKHFEARMIVPVDLYPSGTFFGERAGYQRGDKGVIYIYARPLIRLSRVECACRVEGPG